MDFLQMTLYAFRHFMALKIHRNLFFRRIIGQSHDKPPPQFKTRALSIPLIHFVVCGFSLKMKMLSNSLLFAYLYEIINANGNNLASK